MIALAAVPAATALLKRRSEKAQREAEERRRWMKTGGISVLLVAITLGVLAGWMVKRRREQGKAQVEDQPNFLRAVPPTAGTSDGGSSDADEVRSAASEIVESDERA